MRKHFSIRLVSIKSLLLLCIFLITFYMSPLVAAQLKFAVISDSHISENNSGMVLDAILREIITINASSTTPIKHIVVTGDMVFNHKKFSPQTPESYKQYLDQFFNIINGVLKKTDIKLLVVRGNHDNHYSDDGDHAPYDESYWAILEKNKNLLAAPYNKDQANFLYNVGEFSFVMLNMVSLTQNDKIEATADIDWLNQIKKDIKANVFIFGHYPMFSANKKSYSMLNTASLLDMMAANGYKYYFSGHDHIFNHTMLEKKDSQGRVIASINQIGCPNSAGERFSRVYRGKLSASNADNWEARLNNANATFNDKKTGFLIVDVNGKNVEIIAYKMDFGKVYSTTVN